MVQIKGGLFGSIDEFERRMKSRQSGPITKIEKDQTLVVRFLSEPSDWLGYDEHYTEEHRYFPCTGDGCPGCDEGARASQKILAPALNVDSGQVIVLQLPKGLGETLLKRWKRSKTLLDRDFELSREGEGMMDTRYEALPASPTKRDLRKYKHPDLEKTLYRSTTEEFRDYVGLELDEEEESEPAPRNRTKKAPSKKRRVPEPVDDEDEDDEYEDDEDDDEEDEEELPPSRPVRRKSVRRNR